MVDDPNDNYSNENENTGGRNPVVTSNPPTIEKRLSF